MNKNNQSLESVLDERGPELTAYALGELSAAERAALKKEFSENQEVLSYLNEMEGLGSLLSETVPQKTSHALSERQRAQVLKPTGEDKKSIWQWFKPQISLPALSAAAIATICIVMLPKTQTVHDEMMSDPMSDFESFEGASDSMEYYKFDENEQVIEEDFSESAPPAEAPYRFQQNRVPPTKGAPGSPAAPSPKKMAVAGTTTQSVGTAGSAAIFGSHGGARAAELSDVSLGGSGFNEGRMDKGLSHVMNESKRKRSLSPDGRSNPHFGGTPGDAYLKLIENIFKPVQQEPLSTFSIDVDTASYAQVRTELIGSQLPDSGLVRAEEFINYFKYDYPTPTDGKPFSVNVEVTSAPWKKAHHLVRIGLKGRVSEGSRAASNFVFLVDVSGSMDVPNKLGLVKESLRMLTKTLRKQDRVAIVTYSGSTEVVLKSTSGGEKSAIIAAIDSLNADGSTNGESGIQLAYEIAAKNKIDNGNNRVVLATDGDFNVGITDENSLEEMIEKKAKSSGVFLTVLGYGMGNYQDSRMQKLANKGNGNNYYIDSAREAHKVLVEQGVGTLNAIAKDVKIQVEFHPKHVQSYRLIGYEKRTLEAQDFNDDTKDAGEIGEGHTVTALYEVVPAGIPGATGTVDPLKYQSNEKPSLSGASDELLTVKLRYKNPKEDVSRLMEVPVKNTVKPWSETSSDTRFAAAVAGYTMVLRDSKFKGDFNLKRAQEMAAENVQLRGKTDDYRAEFVELIKKTRSLKDETFK